jgi:hypothetical protein
LGLASYWVRSVVNGGKNAAGQIEPAYTFDRILRVLSSGMGVPLLLERLEFDPVYGWAGALEDIINVADALRLDTNSLLAKQISSYASGTPTLAPNTCAVLSGTVAAATLPLASGWIGKPIEIVKDNLAGAVTISRSGGDTINGAATYSLAGNVRCT